MKRTGKSRDIGDVGDVRQGPRPIVGLAGGPSRDHRPLPPPRRRALPDVPDVHAAAVRGCSARWVPEARAANASAALLWTFGTG